MANGYGSVRAHAAVNRIEEKSGPGAAYFIHSKCLPQSLQWVYSLVIICFLDCLQCG
jgi:hypothetical protein